MKVIRFALVVCSLVFGSVMLRAQEVDSGAHLPSQAAADALREFANADGAFLPAGLLNSVAAKDNLSALLQHPSDTPVVVTLTGTQIRQALEHSVALYPQASSFFLQISGFEVTFRRDASATPRIVSVTTSGTKLDEGRSYTVAMPSQLARGALGYFKIWDKERISRTFGATTMEAVLKGKKYVETAPRYTIVD